MQKNCSHVEGNFLLFCFVICMICKAHMWMCVVADGSCCDHSGEMLRAGPLLPRHSFLIVPFAANEPEKREGSSDCLCFLLDSRKFVPRNSKIIFMKWGGQYFVIWLDFFPLSWFNLTRQSNFSNPHHFLAPCFLLMFIHVLLLVKFTSFLSWMCWYQCSGMIEKKTGGKHGHLLLLVLFVCFRITCTDTNRLSLCTARDKVGVFCFICSVPHIFPPPTPSLAFVHAHTQMYLHTVRFQRISLSLEECDQCLGWKVYIFSTTNHFH